MASDLSISRNRQLQVEKVRCRPPVAAPGHRSGVEVASAQGCISRIANLTSDLQYRFLEIESLCRKSKMPPPVAAPGRRPRSSLRCSSASSWRGRITSDLWGNDTHTHMHTRHTHATHATQRTQRNARTYARTDRHTHTHTCEVMKPVAHEVNGDLEGVRLGDERRHDN